MKTTMKHMLQYAAFALLASCNADKENPVANTVTLHFNNTFKETPVILGGKTSSTATRNTSVSGQVHYFTELKYVISNIRLTKTDGQEIPYNIQDLDKGATVIDQSKPGTTQYVLTHVPAGEYQQIHFGLGVKPELNMLDEVRFPKFYAAAGANDTQMHWEWGTGYRFTKIEGFYGADNLPLSIHSGSTVVGTQGSPDTYTQGIDAYRDITLSFPENMIVGAKAPMITINADFDKLLSGKSHTIKLGPGNDAPTIHSAANMVPFVDNLGGNGTTDRSGIFSITRVTY